MGDRLIRGHFPDLAVRFAVCQTAGLCSDAARRHQADPLAAWLLSEALTCAALLSVNLKHAEKLTLRWVYPGPVGTILADTDEAGQVRGFPQRLRLLEEAQTLDAAIGGDGRLSAITSLPDRVLHTGITEGVFRDVARDMAHLLSLSYQVETALRVGLTIPPGASPQVTSALGVLLQPMPGADLERFEALRQRVESEAFRALLESAAQTPEDVLAHLGPDVEQHTVLGESEPRFACGCSREKVASVLLMLEPDELREIVVEEGEASVNCHFCAELYVFSRREVETMLEQSQVGHA